MFVRGLQNIQATAMLYVNLVTLDIKIKKLIMQYLQILHEWGDTPLGGWITHMLIVGLIKRQF